MTLGILASNIRAGGGLTHLMEFLNNISLDETVFNKVVLWAPDITLEKINDVPFLEKRSHPFLNKTLIHRAIWQSFVLKNEVKNVDLVFAPGGVFYSKNVSYVSMSQNMLVFQDAERKRYGLSWMNFRLKILFYLQSKSIINAKGVVFISDFAKNYIVKKLNLKNIQSTVVYHGIHSRFRNKPKSRQKEGLKLLYVSVVDVYKHQNIIAKAVNDLINDGYELELNFVGPSYQPSLDILTPHLNNKVKYLGKVDYEKIQEVYKDSDVFVFASSCENMPNILVEAMSSGLCVLSSNMGPMPEILKDNGLYFDPLDVESIKQAIIQIYYDEAKRISFAEKSFQESEKFNWQITSKETIQFLNKVVCVE